MTTPAKVILIFIVPLEGKKIGIEVKPSDSIHSVKQKIKDRKGIAIGIQHEQVVRNRHIDSSADLAANLHLSQPERREVVSRRQAPVEATRNCQQREQAGGNAGSNRAQEVTT